MTKTNQVLCCHSASAKLSTMFRSVKKAKRSGQFSGHVVPQLASMHHTLFSNTNNHSGASQSHTWSKIHEHIARERPSDKPKVKIVLDSDEELSETHTHYDEILNT